MWEFLFGSKPVCPIDEDQRRWIEARFAWLQGQFGAEVPRRVRVVLPTPEFFPDPYDGVDEDVWPMLQRIAGYMGVDTAGLSVQVYAEEQAVPPSAGHWTISGSAGCYLRGEQLGQPSVIGIEARQIEEPERLAATLAHELAHHLLLGQRLIRDDEPDGEPLTDLVVAFHGLGVFIANATIRDRGWSDGMMSGWTTSRQGYLDQRMLGYALARFAKARGEWHPAWMKHVRPDVRVVMKKSLKFLASGR